MQRTPPLYLLFFLLIFSCKNSVKEKDSSAKASDSTLSSSPVSKPIIVIHRAKQKFTEAKKPVVSNAGKPIVFSANANVIPVDELTFIEVSKDLTIITPGTDTFPLPKVITAKPKVVVCKQPVPVKALPPRFKDAAISDIQYLDVDQGMS